MPLWMNGQLVAEDAAHIRENDLAVSRGYGVFDYLLVRDGIPVFLDDHIERFIHSARGMHMEVPMERASLKAIIQSLLQNLKEGYADIKLLLTGGCTAYHQPITQPVLMVKTSAWEPVALQPLKLMTHTYQRELSAYKHTNYTVGVWLQPLLRQKQFDDALYVSNGWVTELPRANLFVVTKNGRLVTPHENILHGITRKHVIALAEKIMPVEQRNLAMDELYEAAEIFVTSTTKGVLPVESINGQRIGHFGNGGVTSQLQQLLTNYKALHIAAFEW